MSEEEEESGNEEGEEEEEDEKSGSGEGEGEEEEEDEKSGSGEEEEGSDKKKKDEKGKDKTKFEPEKLEQKNEIKIDLGNNFNNSTFTMGNIPSPPVKTTLQLLNEISCDLDNLSRLIDTKMNTTPPIINPPPIANQYLDNEDLELKQLIDRANQYNPKDIKTFENKCIQSDDEEEKYENNKSKEDIYIKERTFPFDPNKHKEYYENISLYASSDYQKGIHSALR